MDPTDYKTLEIREFIGRHADTLRGDYADIAYDILYLLDTEGGVSSISTEHIKGDPARWKIHSEPQFEKLAMVTVRQHCIDTADRIVQLVDDSGLMRPIALIAALSHDIGKIPRLYNRDLGISHKRAHAASSAKVLTALLLPGRLPEREAELILSAVNRHHNPEDSGHLLDILKRADALARFDEGADFQSAKETVAQQTEPKPIRRSKRNDEYIPRPIDRKLLPFWNIPEYLRILAEHVNAPTHDYVESFSTKQGICYFYPKILFAALHDLCTNHRSIIADIWSASEQRQSDAASFVAGELLAAGAIATDLIPPGRTGGMFWINFKGRVVPSRTHYLVPIRATYLTSDLDLLERRKKWRLSARISYVTPVKPSVNVLREGGSHEDESE
ncbi:HD domain-containing protein [Geobacter argillaceus]|jgi:HD-like signal output (HDOD) protein|uniref:HD domain-containing protein n=1 Tax=Geobacter argillaceus TaxID=345631 RepID=A0A562WV95_9BACT|nr:HD domain-containing protein [Geobacter argillaceus]TWJ33599.1 HD domain-containing protein [Geobacter argillaceus]